MRELDNGVLVLYYHRINNIKYDPFELCVSVKNFEMQMKYIKSHYKVFRFGEEWKTDSKGIVITFDDGYEDNLKNALPILEKYHIPATIFVATGQILRREIMWWDELYELVVEKNVNKYIVIQDETLGCKWRTDKYELKLNCYFAIHKLMNHYISLEKKEEWMEQLRKQVPIKMHSSDYNLLTPDSLKVLSQSELITIGGHTVSHMSLGKMTEGEQETEIKENLNQLEKIISKKITTFSYPFGTVDVDFNDYTKKVCEKYGIKKAATTDQRVWRLGEDTLAVPRCEVKNWEEMQFAHQLENFWRK